MRVAVITPYYKEQFDILTKCHESVLAQSGEVTHVMIADGHPVPEIDNWPNVIHIKIPNSADYGSTPRGIGAAIAAVQDFDAMCFLDADNSFDPNHIELMRSIAEETDAQVVTATRRILTPDGRELGVCRESDGETFTDTNCYFLTRSAFSLCAEWLFEEKHESIVGDRLFWDAVRAANQYTRAHSMTPTVNYVTTHAAHYKMFGETPPDDAKIIVQFANSDHFQMINYAKYEKTPKTPGLP